MAGTRRARSRGGAPFADDERVLLREDVREVRLERRVLLQDEATDELAEYFTGKTPKVIVTTSTNCRPVRGKGSGVKEDAAGAPAVLPTIRFFTRSLTRL